MVESTTRMCARGIVTLSTYLPIPVNSTDFQEILPCTVISLGTQSLFELGIYPPASKCSEVMTPRGRDRVVQDEQRKLGFRPPVIQ